MKLFSRKIKRLNPNNIIVRYNHGSYQGRVQTSLSFEEEYVSALRSAINCVRSGYTDVAVIQYREVLHSYPELQRAVSHLNSYSTDEEVIEEVHNASRSHNRNNMMHLLRSSNKSNALVWASL